MLPQPLHPADEPPPVDSDYPQMRLRRPRLSSRGRMLRFALLAGCGWGAVLALATTIAMIIVAGRDAGLFFDRENPFQFFRTFFSFFASFTPLLVVASAVVAGVHAVLREMRRSAAKQRRSMDALVKRLPGGAGQEEDDMQDPLKNLDLEIDRPRQGER